MRRASTLDELRSARLSLKGTVGFVPTMGFLHEGHLSLIKKAKEDCDRVVVSIFINPAQFGPKEDLSKYPRDLDRDLKMIEPIGTDLVWLPTPEIIYPKGYQTWVEVEAITHPLEGEMRPGHFRGVTTIVAKLFNCVQPQKAYFGQKDAQQAAVIRRMSLDLNFPIEIIVCPTVRESDGLAMSSRNVYLSGDQRKAATVLYRSLSTAKEIYEGGERNADMIRRKMKDVLSEEPLAEVQYVSCAGYDTLKELSTINEKALLSMAVFIGKTRLIDNIVIG